LLDFQISSAHRRWHTLANGIWKFNCEIGHRRSRKKRRFLGEGQGNQSVAETRKPTPKAGAPGGDVITPRDPAQLSFTSIGVDGAELRHINNS
jgi:hypothetical protein